MKKLSFFVGILILLSSCNAQLGNILSEIGGGELTNAEVASGLKEALSKGTTIQEGCFLYECIQNLASR